MNKMYEELEKILESELDIHNSVVDTADKLNKSIRQNNLSDIQAYTFSHDEQLCRIEKLEEKRIEFSSAIGKEIGLETQIPKLAVIIEHAPENRKKRFSEIHSALKNKIIELSKLTVSNQLLLENSMQIINNTLSFVKQSQKKLVPYAADNKNKQSFQAYSLFNRTV